MQHTPSAGSSAAAGAAAADAPSRRAALLLAAAAALPLLPLPARADVDAAAPASSDIIEGTQRWAGLGMQALEVQLQQVAGGDATAAQADPGLVERRRRFGEITVPGLSSFSFVHGLLVGCGAIALLAADRLGLGGGAAAPAAGAPAERPSTPSGLDPDVEAALRVAISDASATFHDPQVHAAIEEVRADISAISKYRDDPQVMSAFQKLLEIEGILERL